MKIPQLINSAMKLKRQVSTSATLDHSLNILLEQTKLKFAYFSQKLNLSLKGLDFKISDHPVSEMIAKRDMMLREISTSDIINAKVTTHKMFLLVPPFTPGVVEDEFCKKKSAFSFSPVMNSESSKRTQLIHFIDKLNPSAAKSIEANMDKINQTAKGMAFQVIVSDTKIMLKDSSAKVLDLTQLIVEGQFVQIEQNSSLFGSHVTSALGNSRYFYTMNAKVDVPKLAGGINLMHQYKLVIGYFTKLANAKDIPFEAYFLEKAKKYEKKPSVASTAPTLKKVDWWHKLKLVVSGNLKLNVKQLSLSILTDTDPRSEDCLRFFISELRIQAGFNKYNLQIKDIYLDRLYENDAKSRRAADFLTRKSNQTSLMKIPAIEVSLNIDWTTHSDKYYTIISENLRGISMRAEQINFKIHDINKQDMRIYFHVNFPHEPEDTTRKETLESEGEGKKEVMQDQIHESKVPIFHYQSELIAELLSLPQLQPEYLAQQGIPLRSLRILQKVINEKENKQQESQKVIQKSTKETKVLKAKSDAKNNSKETFNQKVFGLIPKPVPESNSSPDASPSPPKEQAPIFKRSVKQKKTLTLEEGHNKSNYIELISLHFLRQSAAPTESVPLSDLIKKIRVNLHIPVIRLLLTNASNPKDIIVPLGNYDYNKVDLKKHYGYVEEQPKPDKKSKEAPQLNSNSKGIFKQKVSIQGMQFVLNTITFKSDLKKVKIDKYVSWKIGDNDEAKVAIIYGSLFDGSNLLSISPERFKDQMRLICYAKEPTLIESSYNHPSLDKFFSQEGRKADQNPSKYVQPLPNVPDKITPDAFSEIYQNPKPYYLLSWNDSKYIPSFKKSSTDTDTSPEDRPRRPAIKVGNHSKAPDFDFNSVSGFFKAVSLRFGRMNYQNKICIVEEDNQDTHYDNGISYNNVIFENFVQIQRCKLLLHHYISEVAEILLKEPLEQLKTQMKAASSRKEDKEDKNQENPSNQENQPTPKGSTTLINNKEKLSSKQSENKRLQSDLVTEFVSTYPYAIQIKNLQICLYDPEHGNQLLFSSIYQKNRPNMSPTPSLTPKSSKVSLSPMLQPEGAIPTNSPVFLFAKNTFMKNDVDRIDPKQDIVFKWKQLGVYSAPAKIDFYRKVIWVEDRHYDAKDGEDSSPVPPKIARASYSEFDQMEEFMARGKKGLLNKLIYTDEGMVCQITKFKLPYCEIDFSLPSSRLDNLGERVYTWCNQKRNFTTNILFNPIKCCLNAQEFDSLIELIRGFIKLMAKQPGSQSTPPEPNPSSSSKSSKEKLENFVVDADPIRIAHLTSKLEEEINKLVNSSEEAKDNEDPNPVKAPPTAIERKINFHFADMDIIMNTLDSEPKLITTVLGFNFNVVILPNKMIKYWCSIMEFWSKKCRVVAEYDHSRAKVNKDMRHISKRTEELQTDMEEFVVQSQRMFINYVERVAGAQNKRISPEDKINLSLDHLIPRSEIPQLTANSGFVLSLSQRQLKAVVSAINSKNYMQEFEVDCIDSLNITVKPLRFSLTSEVLNFIKGYAFSRELNRRAQHLQDGEQTIQKGRNSTNFDELLIIDSDAYFKKLTNEIKNLKVELAQEEKENKKNRLPQKPTFYRFLKIDELPLSITSSFILPINNLEIVMPCYTVDKKLFTRESLTAAYLQYLKSFKFTGMKKLASHMVAPSKDYNASEIIEIEKKKEEDIKKKMIFG